MLLSCVLLCALQVSVLHLWHAAAEKTKPPASKMCRADFDCKIPLEECEKGFCTVMPSSCRWPGRPYYGNLNPDLPTYTIGDRVEFFCENGHDLIGAASVTCMEGGRWSRERARCIAQFCPPPGRPYRGRVNPDKDWYTSGERVQYSCKGGFQLGGNPVSRCKEDGTWTGDLPICSKMDFVR